MTKLLLLSFFIMPFSLHANAEMPDIPLSYKLRMQWFVEVFGKQWNEKIFLMSDGTTYIRIAEFPPQVVTGQARQHWTYVTNGMSERKMPGLVGPKVDPRKRLELMVYTVERNESAYELLLALANFPFDNETALGHNHTLPFTHPKLPWSGLILTEPLAEADGSDYLRKAPTDSAREPSVTFLVQVSGLYEAELNYAIEHGGHVFLDRTFQKIRKREGFWSILLFDHPREPVM